MSHRSFSFLSLAVEKDTRLNQMDYLLEVLNPEGRRYDLDRVAYICNCQNIGYIAWSCLSHEPRTKARLSCISTLKRVVLESAHCFPLSLLSLSSAIVFLIIYPVSVFNNSCFALHSPTTYINVLFSPPLTLSLSLSEILRTNTVTF